VFALLSAAAVTSTAEPASARSTTTQPTKSSATSSLPTAPFSAGAWNALLSSFAVNSASIERLNYTHRSLNMID
jgi:hypothetical protein